MLGRAAVAMWWDITPGMQAEFEDWHTYEHMPERLGIPGFLRGSRWIALSGEPSYFVLYETSRLATITAGPYVERLNNPTPWSQKMMPHHRNMVRSLCRTRAGFGGGLSRALGTIRFSAPPGKRRSLSSWLTADAMPELPKRKGLASARLLESQPMPRAPRTTEQAIRGADAEADQILLIGGYDEEAVRAILDTELSADALQTHGALPGSVARIYRLAHSLSSRE